MSLFANIKLIDLTHQIESSIPHWDVGCPFEIIQKVDYAECPGAVKFRVQEFHLRAGTGTHMDAPAHCIPGGQSIAELALEDYLAPCCMLDVSEKITQPDYFISVDDIKAYERDYGLIEKGSVVLAHTGWSKHWHDVQQYRNQSSDGIMHFPGFSADAVEYLLDKNIKGIAIDTLSPDGSNFDFPVHQLILSANKYILENVANANQLPASGAYVLALPLNIVGATESPVRMIGLIEKKLQ